tara:strand:- start:181 stop:666 length:486 start_codon:yes stop_codon:yes gene_type:complete
MPIYFWKPNELPYGMFSQWYFSKFSYENITFNCCEQFMMYYKALLFDDIETAKMILEEKNPRQQKALGRKVSGFDEKKWSNVKESIVYNANYEKFNQNHRLKDVLLSTGNEELCEASPFDTIWGIGLSENDALNGKKWRGKNLLGKALMYVREDLRKDLNL